MTDQHDWNSEAAARLNRVEIELGELRTALDGYASRTAQGISELAEQIKNVATHGEQRNDSLRAEFHRFQETTRPNYLGIGSLVLGLVITAGGLIAFSSDSRIRPIEVKVEAHREALTVMRDEHHKDLAELASAVDKEISGKGSKVEALLASLERRIAVLEAKKFSESDDRQDSELAEIKRRLNEHKP